MDYRLAYSTQRYHPRAGHRSLRRRIARRDRLVFPFQNTIERSRWSSVPRLRCLPEAKSKDALARLDAAGKSCLALQGKKGKHGREIRYVLVQDQHDRCCPVSFTSRRQHLSRTIQPCARARAPIIVASPVPVLESTMGTTNPLGPLGSRPRGAEVFHASWNVTRTGVEGLKLSFPDLPPWKQDHHVFESRVPARAPPAQRLSSGP